MCFTSPPGYQTVHEVKIPYLGPIYGGLKVGMSVYIKGTALPVFNGFNVNLQYGEAAGSDIALHFNPRASAALVVFNNFCHGWKNEERVQQMPFTAGQNFELFIMVTSEGYDVKVNGGHFYLFKHRTAVEQVSTLAIGGDVCIHMINIIGGGHQGICGHPGKGQLVKIPHVERIQGGLKSGMSVHIQGTVPQQLKRFHINLRCGENKCSNIALHLNPRYSYGEVVVLNTHQSGWKREERPRGMPFVKGESFDLVIAVTSEGYQLIVNGHEFYLFRHRIPARRVTVLEIAGEVSVQTVNIIGVGQPASVERAGQIELPVYRIPFLGPIPSGLRAGMTMLFRGTVHSEINRFHINLQCGMARGCNVAFHFNPRFRHCEVVVCNTFRNGGWENEERPAEMPFTRGGDFELLFIITAEGFQVNVNGNNFYLYKHRIPLENVTTLAIVGDVSMQTVSIIGGEEVIPAGPARAAGDELPPAPVIKTVEGGLRTGMSVYIQGRVPNDIARFCINFNCGEMPSSDKTLHFNPRFTPMEVVVINSFSGGRWRAEERVNYMPFIKGESFEMVILLTLKGYEVHVNNRPFYVFKHRLPLERVRCLELVGFHVTTVNIIKAGDMEVQPGVRRLAIGEKIPFMRPIFGGLRPGMSMYFNGTVHQNINRFHINLHTGEVECSDIAMHFNPRFRNCAVIVFNNFHHGWKREERVHQMPFTPGEDFELVFNITTEGYQVLVNGNDLYLFKHRVPVERVKGLAIGGDVSIHKVHIIGGEEAGAAKQAVGEVLVASNTPYARPINVSMRSGMSVYIQGTVLPTVNRFHINFKCGATNLSDIAIHFNPRFLPRALVVLNSFEEGRWRKEDRVNEMPFQKGEDFELLFVITSTGYQVTINGRAFHTFQHRIPVERVTALEIGGEVFVQSVNIMEGRQYFGLQGAEEIIVPEVPYVGPLSSGLRMGMTLVFQGTVRDQANRFHINLQCGEMACSDKAIHINPRFGHWPVMVFNSFRQRWEREERVRKMPFSRGEDFELAVIVTPVGYQVNVNNRPFYLFRHRVPIERVGALEISGDVLIKKAFTVLQEEPETIEPRASLAEVLTIPYLKPISGGLRAGMSAVFKGTVPSDSNRFSINLLCGEKEGSDNALHFNPRFDCILVVFNTYRNGGWEKEERPAEMPFNRGEDFEVIILVTSEGYQVSVNGSQFHLFRHRMPVRRVRALFVYGDVVLHDAYITQGGPGRKQIRDPERELVPNTPYLRPIFDRLRTGMTVYIQGVVAQELNSFVINFKCGEMEGSDIAMHFNPRFRPVGVVVFNSRQNGGWQKEERPKKMPFTKGQRFEMAILVTSQGYQVTVNGRLFHTFGHRLAIDRVTGVEIGGEVLVQNVNIIEGVKRNVQTQGLEEVLVNSMPFLGPISGGLKPGMSLYFQGSIPRKLRSFVINLRCGEIKGADIAMHFNPRFGFKEVVVINSFRHGWKKEERPREMPFTKGQSFEMVIAVTTEGYQVIVNGRHFHLFKHRIPMERVRALEIGGSVTMQTVRILRLNTPYLRPISGGLKPGMTVSVQGAVPQQADRFSINLLCGTEAGSDNALHLNPRFGPNVVVFNTHRGGAWENEERPTGMPFARGSNFELVIAVTTEGYQVNVNGQPFYLFQHRIPVEQVRALSFIQDVSIHDIDIAEGEEGGVSKRPIALDEMATPYVRPLPDGLRRVLALQFQGTVPADSNRFSINLMCGEENDNAFHFNPRFDTDVVVLNTNQKGAWEQEERPENMPFRRGEAFELFIVIKPQGYLVLVNGRKYCLFGHRIPIERVTRLEILGDVSMNAVDVIRMEKEILPICPGVPAPESVPEPPVVLERRVIGNIPYVQPIPDGLKPGMSVFFQGTLPQKIRSFALNFRCGQTEGSDIAMHFNPRFRPCEVVVLNSLQNGGWQNEERVTNMLFDRGQSFDMMILITPEFYQVAINRSSVYKFKHRIPLEQVNSLEVVGDVFVETLDVIEEVPGGIATCPGEPVETMDDVEEPDTLELPVEEELILRKAPIRRPFLGGLKLGMSLLIQGIAPSDIPGFGVNLRSGEAGADIALHCNPRFEPEAVVVFNSCLGGAWGEEERPAEMPFCRGESFTILIILTAEGYQINVNGRELHFYKHRVPLDQVNTLEMDEAFSLLIDQGEPTGVKGEVLPEPPVAEVLPYAEPIPDGLKPGMSLYFQGSIPDDLTSFSINLMCDNEDNALHFNPQFDSGVVVFNTRRDGNWENEERPAEMPLRRGEDFELLFVITAEGYQVNVNGVPFYLFNQRIPLEQVTFLMISGDLLMRNISIIKAPVPEEPKEAEETVVPPYVQPISGDLKTGKSLYFQGMIPDDTDRFSIDLPCGKDPDSDIALRFDVQLVTSVVILNTLLSGVWGEEERVAEMPFRVGENFELVFLLTVDGFQVLVNGIKFYLFKYRIPVERVGAVQIDGPVSMLSVTTMEGGENDIQEQLDVNETIYTAPYVQPLPDGLKEGTSLYFQGSVLTDIESFSILLQCGEDEGCDVALDFIAQFKPEKAALLNSFEKGAWGQAEKMAELPFTEGEGFEISIIITDKGYEVSTKEQQTHLFMHRIPVDQVRALKIVGGVCVETITIIEVSQIVVPGAPGDGIQVCPDGLVVVEEVQQIPSFLQPICSLVPGMSLYFQGSIPMEIDRFSIDLMCGEAPGSDMALCFRPEFQPSEALVLNSFQDGQWGKEKRLLEMPFTKGSNFELVFNITSVGYQVKVGGKEILVFKHRLDMGRVSAIQITGNVAMQSLNIIEGGLGGAIEEGLPIQGELEVISGQPIFNPPLPYSGEIPGGLKEKKTLVITGTVPPEAKSFSCSLMTSSGDVAFQMSPQISEGVVVRNSCLGGSWGEEERETDFNPFQEGSNLEMLIRCGNKKFKVFANGQHVCDYAHRLTAFDQIDKLLIDGDLQVSYVLL